MEAALLFNDKKFPPLLPRKLRITRAKSIKRNPMKGPTTRKPVNGTADRTMQGRAGKLLGKAGAAQIRHQDRQGPKRQKINGHVDESDGKPLVFEGHRATSKDTVGLKMGGKKKGKPKNRGAKRAAAWRKSKAS